MASKVKSEQGAPAAQVDLAAQAVQAWKQQFDTTLQMIEALTEGAVKMRESQLKAAVDAHACAAAAQKSASEAGDPARLLGVESEWLQHNLEHSAAYWRSLFEASLETQSNLLKCLAQHPALKALPGAPQVDFDATKGAMLGMVEKACGQWLEASRRTAALAADLDRPPAH